jgi:hypothetical protein
METSKSLVNLSEALEKLRMRKPDIDRPRTSIESDSGGSAAAVKTETSVPTTTERQEMPPPTASTSRLLSTHRPRHSLANIEEGDKSLAALVCSTIGEGCLKGVVAYVDVRTGDGDDASPIFTEMLRGCGAKVSFGCPNG